MDKKISSSYIEIKLKTAMRNTCSSVYIASSGNTQSTKNAVTITSFTVVSVCPPLILFCVNRESKFAKTIAVQEKFNINFINEDQIEIAKICSEKNINTKFSTGLWEYNEGIPYLSDSNSILFCKKEGAKESGTHLIIFGSVENIIHSVMKKTLIYYNKSYSFIGSHL